MAVDNSQYCVSCNPSENWIQLEFRSEKDEAISSLEVTIVDAEDSEQKQKTNGKGIVTFGKVALGQVGVFVSLESLLEEVEKYPKRNKEKEPDSPVKQRAEKELNAKKEDTKLYRHVSIGDLWDEKPEDEDLVKIQEPLNSVRADSKFGIKAPVNETTTYEVQAVRSLMPAIIDTDKYSLVNSYTFSLLATQAYATKNKNADTKDAGSTGSLETVTEKFAAGLDPEQASTLKVDWLTTEIPYSKRLRYEYYEDKKVGSQAYIFFNDEVAIIGVRGTETDGRSEEMKKALRPSGLKVFGGLLSVGYSCGSVFIDSPLWHDAMSDLDGAQIEVSELGSDIYLHRGFYEYTKSLWKKISDDLDELHSNKKVYICGHSLGGAGAFILAALVKKNFSPVSLRLFTYGMPRTGTKSFVTAYSGITHYRHVNNNDLVTQVPWKWVNTNPNEIGSPSKHNLGTVLSGKSFMMLLGDMLIDNDDDNYHHHGRLVQLFAYSKQKNEYNASTNDAVKQILILPSQHHIQSTELALAGENDSFALADDTDYAAIRRGGLIDTFGIAVSNHYMSEYVPNLKKTTAYIVLPGTKDNIQQYDPNAKATYQRIKGS